MRIAVALLLVMASACCAVTGARAASSWEHAMIDERNRTLAELDAQLDDYIERVRRLTQRRSCVRAAQSPGQIAACMKKPA